MQDQAPLIVTNEVSKRTPHIPPSLWLIAMSPLLFALSTWSQVAQERPVTVLTRFFSLPIIVVELIVVVLALASGAGIVQRVRQLPRWVGGTLVLLALIAIGTIWFVAIDKQVGALKTAFWFLHVAFALSIASLVANRWRLSAEEIWNTMLLGLVGYLVIAVIFVATMPDPVTFDWVGFKLGAINIRHTAAYCVIGFMVALALAILAKTVGRRFIFACCAIGFVAFTFWSGTRAAFPAIAAALGLAALLFRDARSVRACSLIAISILGGMFVSLLFPVPYPHTDCMACLNGPGIAASKTPLAGGVRSGRQRLQRSQSVLSLVMATVSCRASYPSNLTVTRTTVSCNCYCNGGLPAQPCSGCLSQKSGST